MVAFFVFAIFGFYETPSSNSNHRWFNLFFSSLKEADKTVYICASKTAKKYHYKKNCRGLSACKHEIKAIDLSKAKSSGRTLCGWED